MGTYHGFRAVGDETRTAVLTSEHLAAVITLDQPANAAAKTWGYGDSLLNALNIAPSWHGTTTQDRIPRPG